MQNFIAYLRDRNGPTFSLGYWDQIPEVLLPIIKQIVWNYRNPLIWNMQYEKIAYNYKLNLIFLMDWCFRIEQNPNFLQMKGLLIEEFESQGIKIETWLDVVYHQWHLFVKIKSLFFGEQSQKDRLQAELEEQKTKFQEAYNKLLEDEEKLKVYGESIVYSLHRATNYICSSQDQNASTIVTLYYQHVWETIKRIKDGNFC